MDNAKLCPSCGDGPVEIFHRTGPVPSNSCLLFQNREEAVQCEKGHIALGFCPHCGFIHNTAFLSEKTHYTGAYEATQRFSPTFTAFQEEVASDLVTRYRLRGKCLMEIGCGMGEFLSLLCQKGDNQGLGIDPAVDVERARTETSGQIHFIKDYFRQEHGRHRPDFICCKMTLEHIPEVSQFIRTLQLALAERPAVPIFFQVPEATRIFKTGAFEDIYYEHCSYFSPDSLRRLFHQHGFEVTSLRTGYDGQYLLLEARSSSHSQAVQCSASEMEDLRNDVEKFSKTFAQKMTYWSSLLSSFSKGKVALWGSGSKAVAFLHALNSGQSITQVVDIDPYRQGHFMPGTGQQIIPPEGLCASPPEAVIVMNPIYCKEIAASLSALSLHPQLMSL
jgi:hypothetical protein